MGEGYLAVETPAGNEAYTRAGNIQIDTFGAMSINGFPVVGENGPLVVLIIKKSKSVSVALSRLFLRAAVQKSQSAH